MGTKAHPGPFDCHAGAADDEPIFTLRANDPLAADLVREWARRHIVQKLIKEGCSLNTTRSKCLEAIDCADDMDRWRSATAPAGPKPMAKPAPAGVLVDGRDANSFRWTHVSMAGQCSGCDHMLEVGDEALLVMSSGGDHVKILCIPCGDRASIQKGNAT